MTRYPAADFEPPSGAVLVLERDGEVVASGAYKRLDEATAELKRVWTSPTARRQGLAARMVTALEEHARTAGYTRVYLTTGPRQPEARALYLARGYRPLGDHDAVVRRADGPLAFDKDLPSGDEGARGRHDDLDQPA